jgi:hypothetical protein
MKKRAHKAAAALAAGLALSGPASAALVTADWVWTGNAGWQARGVVTWEDTIAFPTATGSRTSAGLSNTGIDYLTVALYTPAGTVAGAWDQVLNGVVLGYYVEATIDAAALDFAAGSMLNVGDHAWAQVSQMTVVFGTGAALLVDNRVWDRGEGAVSFVPRQPPTNPIPTPAPLALIGLGLLLSPIARRRLAAGPPC